MKLCTRCKVEKEESEFREEPRVKSGRTAQCAQCCRDRQKKYRKANPEKTRSAAIKWKQGKGSGYYDSYYKQNKELVGKIQARYFQKAYSSNKEKFKNRSKEYRTQNKDKITHTRKENYNRNVERISAKKKRQISELADSYVKQNLVKRGWNPEVVNSNPILIEVKRKIIQLKRICKHPPKTSKNLETV